MPLVIALVLLLLAAAPAGAVEVRETTVLHAGASGWVDVEVPEGVSVAWTSGSAAAPEGLRIDAPADRLAAVVVQRFVPQGDALRRDVLTLPRFPEAMTLDGAFRYGDTLSAIPTTGALPAGSYRLALHTEPGVPATAELRFEGAPAGRLELVPTRPLAPVDVRRGGSDGPAFSLRAERRFAPGVVADSLTAVALRGRAPGAWRASVCSYADDGSFPEAKDAPTCTPARITTLMSPGGGGSGGQPNSLFVPTGVGEESFTRPSTSAQEAGVSTLTASAQVLGAPVRIEGLAAWFDLGPLPSRPATG